MHDELTKNDIAQMQSELDHRRQVLRPQLLEEVKTARAFGDLSENFEYKAAKRDKNHNESRIRYLENMIKTAHIISERSSADVVGLYDKVTVYLPEDDMEETYQLVTTLRSDPLSGIVSKESPLGKALMGHRVGETLTICASADYSYPLEIRHIEKGADDGSIPISPY